MSLNTLDPELNSVVACPDITLTDNTTYDTLMSSEVLTNGNFSLTVVNPSNSNGYGFKDWYYGFGTFTDDFTIDIGKLIGGYVQFGTSPIRTGPFLNAGSSYTITFDLHYTSGSALILEQEDGSAIHTYPTTTGTYTTSFVATGSYLTFFAFGSIGINHVHLQEAISYNRNISILKPDGVYAALGTKQKYTFLPTESTFINNSQLGRVFTLSACNDSVTYSVPVINSSNDFTCMVQDILNLLNTTTTGEFKNYIYTLSGNTITLEFSEPGIPVPFLVSYSAGNTSLYYELTQSVSASQSLGVQGTSNDLIYTPSEHGGMYTITLSIWGEDPCDRRTLVLYLWNWCYDYKLLNQCFIKLVKDQECGCAECRHELCNKATSLRNLMQAAQLTEQLTGSGPDVQYIIDSALAICDCDLGCIGC